MKTIKVKDGSRTLIYSRLKRRRRDGVVATLTAYTRNGTTHKY